jgi:hypothetical protein
MSKSDVQPMVAAAEGSSSSYASGAAARVIPDLPPAAAEQYASARTQLAAGQVVPALKSLQKLHSSGTNLSGGQIAAIHEQMVQIQSTLAERAAAGDAKAKQALEDFSNSLAP